ncbi:hypothetical protein BGZ80_003152 [Entomortierella chlamydospora]|uniref:Uncharacterized protein n=1 Tax=Entomortierella chlamydospora TaxID=101097 RepID=A0A9P6MPC1_9FUNG|nr:hypothetical protein BGZ80_003152 [Entomortierella chlamydospora]
MNISNTPRPLEVNISFQSENNWTRSHLRAFNITVQPVDADDVPWRRDLIPEAQAFLESNADLGARIYRLAPTLEVPGSTTRFKRKALIYTKMKHIEASVGMMQNLLESVLSDMFEVTPGLPNELRVGNNSTDATSDLAVVHFPIGYQRVIVVKDKLDLSTGAAVPRENAEAQMVAKGIAICQKEGSPRDLPMYMMRVNGSRVNVYMAQFDEPYWTALLREHIVRSIQPCTDLTLPTSLSTM